MPAGGRALDARHATVFVHPTSPCCFETFGLALPAPMIEFPFDTTRTAVSLIYSGALARHPRIRFILPHAGGTLPFLAAHIAAIGSIPVLGDRAMAPADAMKALTRFHYDTALSETQPQITALRALAPLSQLLYGTDFPFAMLHACLRRLRHAVVAPQESGNDRATREAVTNEHIEGCPQPHQGLDRIARLRIRPSSLPRTSTTPMLLSGCSRSTGS